MNRMIFLSSVLGIMALVGCTKNSDSNEASSSTGSSSGLKGSTIVRDSAPQNPTLIGEYKIANAGVASENVWTANQDPAPENGSITLAEDGGLSSQQFKVFSMGDGQVVLQEEVTDLCVDVNGTSLITQSCGSTVQPLLTLIQQPDGAYVMQSMDSRLCVSLTAANGSLELSECNGGPNQNWVFSGPNALSL